jgi:hypothetical protein
VRAKGRGGRQHRDGQAQPIPAAEPRAAAGDQDAEMTPGRIAAAPSRCPNGTKEKHRRSTFAYFAARLGQDAGENPQRRKDQDRTTLRRAGRHPGGGAGRRRVAGSMVTASRWFADCAR